MSLEVPRDAKFRGAESSECQEQEDTDAAQLLCLPGVGFGSTCHLQENISRLGGALDLDKYPVLCCGVRAQSDVFPGCC